MLQVRTLARFVQVQAPLWILAGCDAPAVRTEVVTVRDSAGVRIVENLGPTWTTPWRVDPEPVLTIGSAEGDPDQVLDHVSGAVKLSGQQIVVANEGQLELLFYDTSGSLIRRVGGRGGGPGEFESLEWLARFGTDSILALDVLNQRVSYFDAEGNFGRSVRLLSNARIPFPRAVGFFGDGSMLATRGLYQLGGDPPIRVERTPEPLFRISPDGETAAELGVFPGRERVMVPTGPGGRFERRGRPFGRESAFAAAGDRFYAADNERYEIRAYSMTGQVMQIVRKQSAQPPITDADVRAFEDSILRGSSELDRHQLLILLDRLPPHPETYPAFAAELHVDADLHLWVRESTPRGTQESVWSVFSSEGELLGSVGLPVQVRLLDLGIDYLLVLRRDDLDVEYVELYRLRRTP